MQLKYYFVPGFLLVTASLFAQQPETKSGDQIRSYAPMVSKGALLGAVPPLRTLKPLTSSPGPAPAKLWHKRNYFVANTLKNPDALPGSAGDPLVGGAHDRNGGEPIIPTLNFEGLRDPNGASPPDPNGDIGKDHYMQMVNTYPGAWFQIWDKQGQSVYGPALTNTIWSQVGTGSFGDPVIQYDQDAERWIMMELEGSIGVNELVVAVSDDSDPTGSWKAYRFQTLGFPDFPKLYVWNNAYIVCVNEYMSNGQYLCSGYALERSAMLAGAPSFQIYRFELPNYQNVTFEPATGADWEGGPPPPPGSPGYLFRVYDDSWGGGQDQLQIWEMNINWQDVGQSSVSGPQQLYPAPFELEVCWGVNECLEQPDTGAPRISAMENILMYRAAYRNFGDHESVVFNHATDVSGQVGSGGDAAVRWYELRRTGGSPWQIYQQGTHVPDLPTNRFMASIAMDGAGNIGMGYSVCSQQTYPGLRVTGRRAGDPLNDMSLDEQTIIDGQNSHWGDNRWGDYSNIALDPVDERTFWFTGEYQPNDGPWATRITKFRIQRDSYDVKPIALTAPVASALLGTAETVTVSVLNNGLKPVTGVSLSLNFENGVAVATETLPDTIQPGLTVEHTFSSTVDMSVFAKNYAFEVISHFPQDQFVRNDTLRATVKKLTASDASAAGKTDLPGLVCGSTHTFRFVLGNASGLPMQSARVRWRVNGQIYQTYNWTGNLAPGARDTIPLLLSGIANGVNSLRAFTTLPNGQDDQDKGNDTLNVKFYGNLDGTYLQANCTTNAGRLKWELRTPTNQVLVSGELPETPVSFQICSDDNTCYQLVLKAATFAWEGHFRLLDIFGNVLAEATQADNNPLVFEFCTPARQHTDVGPLMLVSPVTDTSLTTTEPVRIAVRNFGLTVQSNLEVSYRVDGSAWQTGTIAGPVQPGETVEYDFVQTADLSIPGKIYAFDLRATVTGDQATGNDTAHATVQHVLARDLALVALGFENACSNTEGVTANITLKNLGFAPIQGYGLQYRLNGGAPKFSNSTQLIAPGESVILNAAIMSALFGPNTFAVEITDVGNTGKDFMPANDTISGSFALQPGFVAVKVQLITDQHPEQNSWEITDQQGVVVANDGPFGDHDHLYQQEICLPRDSCYTFKLFDSGGDGLEGYAALWIDNAPFWFLDPGALSSELEVPFCAKTGCSSLLLIADAVPASGIGTHDGRITVTPQNGTPPFQYTLLPSGMTQPDSVFTNLASGDYTIICLDADFCSAQASVFVGSAVGTTEPAQHRRLSATPNPSNGLVWLSLHALGAEETAVCTVFDSRGKQLYTSHLSRWDDTLRGAVPVETYPAGIYLIRVQVGREIFTTRVVRK